MKWLGIILLIGLSACCPQRLLNTSTTDSIRVEIRERIVKQIDTVLIKIPIETERVIVRDSISHLETSFAASDASIDKDGYLHHSIWNITRNYPIEVKTEVKVHDSIVYRDREMIKIVEVERKLNWWQKLRMDIGGWLMGASLLVIIWFIVKRFILKK